MPHRKFEFFMPASSSVVFDAFHYHAWRARWDTLVSSTHIEGGAPCPYVGAISENSGSGILHSLSMKTQFVAFSRPMLAAAKMTEQSFPFSRWAASMQHQEIDQKSSTMIYTYTFDVSVYSPAWLVKPVLEFMVQWIFDYQTRRRFNRLSNFLATHAEEIEGWQATSISYEGLQGNK